MSSPSHTGTPNIYPNHVWCADITYHPGAGRIPVLGGDHGLGEPAGAGVAVVQHDGHRVLCLAVLAEALEGYGIPEIFNTDQGSQFTSIALSQRPATRGTLAPVVR